MAQQPVIYHNPRCKKSREALNALKEKGYDPEVIKYLDHPPTPDELKEVLKKADLKVDQVIRKEEKLYKEQYKGKELSEDDWLKVLNENPRLIQRPLVVYGERACLARPMEEMDKIL